MDFGQAKLWEMKCEDRQGNQKLSDLRGGSRPKTLRNMGVSDLLTGARCGGGVRESS